MACVSIGTIWNIEEERVGPSKRSQIRQRFEAMGVVFVPGGARLASDDDVLMRPKGSPLRDGRFTPRRDGRIILLRYDAVRVAFERSKMTVAQLALAGDFTPELVRKWIGAQYEIRMRPENAERLWVAFDRVGVALDGR